MNAVKALKEDHVEVKGLFREFDSAGEKALKTKLKLAREIITELEVHTDLEEKIFYPAAKARGDKEIKGTVDEGLDLSCHGELSGMMESHRAARKVRA